RSGVDAAQVNAVAGSNPARRAVARFALVDWSSFSQRLTLHAQPGFAFVFIRSNPESDIPWRRRLRRSLKINRRLTITALAQTQHALFVISIARRRSRLDVARES